jgi:hypothetical protein
VNPRSDENRGKTNPDGSIRPKDREQWGFTDRSASRERNRRDGSVSGNLSREYDPLPVL